jgi:hypothetical protein
MRAHFRHLRFKSFPTVPRAQQSIEIRPFNSHSEISGVHQVSLSQNGSCLGSVSAHSLTLTPSHFLRLPGVCDDSRASSWPTPFQCLLPLLPGFFPLDSRNFATPCLGCEPKAKVATIHLFVLFEHQYHVHCLDMNVICLFVLFRHECCVFVCIVHTQKSCTQLLCLNNAWHSCVNNVNPWNNRFHKNLEQTHKTYKFVMYEVQKRTRCVMHNSLAINLISTIDIYDKLVIDREFFFLKLF